MKRFLTISIMAVLAFGTVVLSAYTKEQRTPDGYGEAKKLSEEEISEAREQYVLYTDINAGFKESLILGTEELSERAFSYMVETAREKQNFALVKAVISKVPKQRGAGRYQIEADCVLLAGEEEVEEHAVLYCTTEYFYDWEEILKEGQEFLFFVADGRIDRNKSWYIVEKKGTEYVLPVLDTEAMERYEGALAEEIIALFSE